VDSWPIGRVAGPAIVSWGPASPSCHVTDWREHILVINVRTACNKAWRLFAIIDWIQSALWATPDLLVHTRPVDLRRRNLLGELVWSHQMTHFQESLKVAVVNDYKCHPIFRSPQISLLRVHSVIGRSRRVKRFYHTRLLRHRSRKSSFPLCVLRSKSGELTRSKERLQHGLLPTDTRDFPHLQSVHTGCAARPISFWMDTRSVLPREYNDRR